MLNLINKHKCSTISKPLHTGSDSYVNESELDGTTEHIFIVNFIDMLDKAMVKDNYKYLSMEQEDVLKKYFIDADNNNLSDYNKQLDNYLGNYLGELNNIYYKK